MISNIITGISTKLNQVFGDEYKIYTDIIQDLTVPYFFIAVVTSSQIKRMGQRYFMKNSFDIQYFPEGSNSNSEIQSMASNLFEAIEYITLPNGDLLHGTSMNYEIIDSVLHFKVNYNLFIVKETQLDLMETVDVDTKTT